MRDVVLNALLVAVAVCFALLLAEVGIRMVAPHPQVVDLSASPADPAASEGDEGGARLELDERIDEPEGLYVSTPTGRRLRPNTRAVIREQYLCRCRVEIRTNSLGYRNPELGEKRRPRVLFLGDSITLADYVSEEESWVRRTQALSEQGARPLETVNAGVYAIGLANELAILLETGLQAEPDVVVLAWYLNDVEPSPGITMLRAPELLDWSWLAQYAYQGISVLRSQVVRVDYSEIDEETRERWKRETALAFPPGEGNPDRTQAGFNRIIQELFFDWGSAFSDGAWEHMRPYFTELRRQADLHGFQLLFLAFPVQNQVVTEFVKDYPQRKLAEVASSLGVPVLDLLPVFRQAHQSWVAEGRPEQGKLFYDWCHHTPAGNELIARHVNAFLEEHVAAPVTGTGS